MAGQAPGTVEERIVRLERRLLRVRRQCSRVVRRKSQSTKWQLLVILLPVVATATGGFIVNGKLAQFNATLKAGEQRQEVLLRIAETLYTKQLATYAGLDQALLELEARVNEGQFISASESRSRARLAIQESTIKLRTLYLGQRLYLTAKLPALFVNVVKSANQASRVDVITRDHVEALRKAAEAVRQQMALDLRPDVVSTSPLYEAPVPRQ
jgi:hypothetical protein